MNMTLRFPLRALMVFAAMTLMVLAFQAPSFAATLVEEVAADPVSNSVAVAFTMDPLAVVQLIVAFVLPVLVGLVTSRVTSSNAKAWLLAALSLLTSLLVELARALEAGNTYDVGTALTLALPTFIIAVSGHYGLWKPTGISGAAQDVGSTKS